jgi:hypothetical protein
MELYSSIAFRRHTGVHWCGLKIDKVVILYLFSSQLGCKTTKYLDNNGDLVLRSRLPLHTYTSHTFLSCFDNNS